MKKLDGRTKAGKEAKFQAEQRAKWGIPQEASTLTNIDAVLGEREKRYGDFKGHAFTAQQFKSTMRCSPKWTDLEDDQAEALEMIAHKIGRILNGDPNYADAWVDIAGYAKLVADRLEKEAGK